MSAAFKRKGRNIHTVKVPTRDGDWLSRTSGKRDRSVARKMQAMINAIGPEGKGAWDLLETVTGTPQRWTVAELYERWTATPVTRHDKETGAPIEPSVDERIAHVRQELRVTNVVRLVDDWCKVLTGPAGGAARRGRKRISTDTADHYRASVRGYLLDVLELEEWKAVPKDAVVLASEFSESKLSVYIEEMDDVESATVRKRGIGLGRFTEWLVGRGVLGIDPMRNIVLPAPGDPLSHHLETEDAIRLADATPGQMRLFEYLLPGSAIEVSVALALRVRDVIKDERRIRAAGTKTWNRDRIVRVADYAWDAVLELCKGKHPDSRLFDQIPHRWAARDAHVEVVNALVGQGHAVYVTPKLYTLRDHRHTWAVRAVRSGWPIEAVSRQLGHKDGVLALKVYGRWVPRKDEIEMYEAMATARDEARRTEHERRAAQ